LQVFRPRDPGPPWKCCCRYPPLTQDVIYSGDFSLKFYSRKYGFPQPFLLVTKKMRKLPWNQYIFVNKISTKNRRDTSDLASIEHTISNICRVVRDLGDENSRKNARKCSKSPTSLYKVPVFTKNCIIGCTYFLILHSDERNSII
jgi:hypothetical protein